MVQHNELVPTSIKLSASGGMAIIWNDGHAATYPHAYLRQRCPCAICREKPPEVKTVSDPFPILGKNPIALTGATPIGRYAIQFLWNDRHAEGIYSYGYLREICPCKRCQEG